MSKSPPECSASSGNRNHSEATVLMDKRPRLYHISEQTGIELFEPRPMQNRPDRNVVRAILIIAGHELAGSNHDAPRLCRRAHHSTP